MGEILLITSAYRKGSNSNELAYAFADGAKEAGHSIVILDISKKTIHSCRGCMACLRPNAKGCVIQDDMQEMYPIVQKTDVLFYVSPIYWFNLCGQIKQFIDRCFAIAVSPSKEQPSCFAKKSLGGIFVYGDEDPLSSGCINAIRSLQDTCEYVGAKWLGAIHGTAWSPYSASSSTEDIKLVEEAKKFGASLKL